MTKMLVVYYSMTGMTRKVAEELARATGAHVGEIRDRHPRKGGWGNLRCVFEVLFGLTPAIDYHGPDPGTYDLVLIGTPVWVGRIASPVRTFLAQHAARCRRFGWLVTFGGQGADAAIERARPLLPNGPVQALLVRDEEITSGAYIGLVRAFAQTLAPEPALR